MLLDEHNLVVEHINGLEVTRATLFQLAVSSILSKKAGKEFDKAVSSLNIETVAHEEAPVAEKG
jgi:hypothetical protein